MRKNVRKLCSVHTITSTVNSFYDCSVLRLENRIHLVNNNVWNIWTEIWLTNLQLASSSRNVHSFFYLSIHYLSFSFNRKHCFLEELYKKRTHFYNFFLLFIHSLFFLLNLNTHVIIIKYIDFRSIFIWKKKAK